MDGKNDNFSVFITGFHNSAKKHDILNLFSSYGVITDTIIGPHNRFAIITFDNPQTVEKVLQAKLKFQDRYLRIRPRIIKERSRPVSVPKVTPDHNMLNTLTTYKNFDEQLRNLITMLQFPLHVMEQKYGLLCSDLERTLSVLFPGCCACPFGSTISGLGFRTSDVDIFIKIPCFKGDTDSKQLVNKSKVELYRSKLFTKIIAIPNANIPIVRCVHTATGVSCDFNFKSMLGVCNTSLIKYLLSLDRRLLPMMIIVKYWAKVHNITGVGKISNYSLIMLIIFYLQQIPESFYVPISKLQTTDTERMAFGWNVGFSTSPHLILPITNKLSIIELLNGFFKFCARFDFALKVISVYNGCTYPKSDFERPEDLPDNFSQYKIAVITKPGLKLNTAMCIQDPIEHTHNITAGVYVKLVEHFQKMSEFSADLSAKYLTTQQHEFLPKLFDHRCKLQTKVLNLNKTYLFKLSIADTYANIHNPNIKQSIEVLRETWFGEVIKFFKLVLNKILGLDVTDQDSLAKNKIQRNEGQSDVHNGILDSTTYKCSGTKNIFESRQNATQLLKKTPLFNDLNFFQLEYAITAYIADNETQTKPIHFDAICSPKINPTEMEIVLMNTNCNIDIFIKMSVFVGNKFSKFFTKYMNLNDSEKLEIEQSQPIQIQKILSQNDNKTDATTTTESESIISIDLTVE